MASPSTWNPAYTKEMAEAARKKTQEGIASGALRFGPPGVGKRGGNLNPLNPPFAPGWQERGRFGVGPVTPPGGGMGPTYPGGAPGAGGGGGGGGGTPVGPGTSVQVNPYQKEAFDMYRQLMEEYKKLGEKAPDPTAALQNYRDLMAGGMAEATAGVGARGFGGPGTGLSAAARQQALRGFSEEGSKLTSDWANTALQFKANLLGQMAQGIGGAAGLGLGMGGQGIGWYSAVQNAANDAERNKIAWYNAMNNAQYQPLQYMTSLVSALGGLV